MVYTLDNVDIVWSTLSITWILCGLHSPYCVAYTPHNVDSVWSTLSITWILCGLHSLSRGYCAAYTPYCGYCVAAVAYTLQDVDIMLVNFL